MRAMNGCHGRGLIARSRNGSRGEHSHQNTEGTPAIVGADGRSVGVYPHPNRARGGQAAMGISQKVEKPVILAVDDEPTVLSAVARDLRREYGQQYRVMRADSGVAALELLLQLKLRNVPVALFLVDQRMPLMSGVEFLAEAIELFPDAKRVLLTAYADTEAAISAINEVDLNHYLMKPWDPPEEHLYPYQWLDVEIDEEARGLLELSGSDGSRLPLVLFPEGLSLTQPTNVEIAEKVGLRTYPGLPFYDLVIVGAGPAGLAAAVYGGPEGLSTLPIKGEAPGGQAGTSSRIEN